ncbi:polymeric immunoglobulin receptor isoform 2-T2 [Aulostomus maculatus]
MPQVCILVLSLMPWIPALLCGVTTVKELSVLEGQTLAIPCHYEPQYASYVKYWCRGRMREFCSSLARTDDTDSVNPSDGKVSIFDDQVQLVFTVTMKGLKEDDSGWYMCGVERGGVWSADVAAFTNIKVIHGMSAANRRLSGEEGSSVTVQCLYSERYRESEKRWCRSGDWSSCVLIGSGGSYVDTSVAINDDRIGTFTVTFKKLRMRDTGWYFCTSGQQQTSVQVLVTARASTTVPVMSNAAPGQSVASLPPPKPITKDSSKFLTLESLMLCGTFMVLVGLAIFARKMWKMHKKKAEQRHAAAMKARLTESSGEASDLQNATVVFLNSNSPKAYVY